MKILLYLTAIAIGFTFVQEPINDPDLGWHLFGGAWISNFGYLPRSDVVNSFNSVWRDYHWLAQIVIYQLYDLGWYPLLKIAYAALVAYLFKVVLDIILTLGGRNISFTISLVVFLLCVALIAPHLAIRPQVMALFLIALALRAFLHGKREHEPLLIVGLALLTAVTANIHVYWVIFPFIWGALRVIPALLRQRYSRKYSLLVLAVLFCCGALSPYGLNNYLIVWDYLQTDPYLSANIDELRGGFRQGGSLPYLLAVYLLILLPFLPSKRARADCGRAFLALSGVVLTIYSAKFAPLLALFSLPFLIRHILRPLRKVVPRLVHEEQTLFGILAGTVLLASILVSAWNWPSMAPQSDPDLTRRASFTADLPVQACGAASQTFSSLRSKQRTHWRILTHFNDGGWCRWGAYLANPLLDMRVTTDGRTQDADPRNIERSSAIYNLEGDWQKTLADWAPEFILARNASPFQTLLAKDPAWREIYSDRIYKVFVFERPNLPRG
ncbi:MAG: hypothetical protein KDD42_04335 [Bdellovibrionales bacterium]|nr:hypothetical protein [Bdellovibrionales bacterium]